MLHTGEVRNSKNDNSPYDIFDEQGLPSLDHYTKIEDSDPGLHRRCCENVGTLTEISISHTHYSIKLRQVVIRLANAIGQADENEGNIHSIKAKCSSHLPVIKTHFADEEFSNIEP